MKPKFLGKEIRGVRRHYAWLRRRLQEKGLLKVVILGDLKGIRKQRRDKRLNRIVSNMPCYRLTQMITYKAMMKGIPVITTSEAYTSRTCHICNCEGRRKTQGLFVCPYCGEYNADLGRRRKTES